MRQVCCHFGRPILIGVLAAGLLGTLRSDLEATTQANRGQSALHLADAGAQAAAA